MSDTNTTVTLNEERSRYEILIDGQVAGFAEFAQPSEDVRDFNHTVVEPQFRGQGLSSTLIKEALDDTRTAGKKIIATCSAVQNFLGKNEQYRDLVAE